jgi:type II secretory pathway pseudopilin PulG
MGLRGQAEERGYAMAALLVSIAVMAIIMSALLPVWHQQAQREKEAELAFRGEQYARAIYLYQAKFQSPPPSLDVLVQQRFLRKKYKDPMTKDGEFQLLYAGSNTQPGMPQTGPGGTVGRGRQGVGPTAPGAGVGGLGTSTSTSIGSGQSGAAGTQLAGGLGGIMGVVSKSKEASIRVYRGGTHYNEWRFLYNAQGRGGAPGQRGAPGMGPGGQPMPGMPGRPGGPGRGPGGQRPMFPGQPGGRGPGRGAAGFAGPSAGQPPG